MRQEDPSNAMNPSDGLLLCRLCDKAFEDDDIQVMENCEIIVSKRLTGEAADPALRSWCGCIHQKIPIKPNSEYRPSEKYLRRKIELNKKP
jgi:hypothetical protein